MKKTRLEKELEKAIKAADAESRMLPGYNGRVFSGMITAHTPIPAAKRILQPIPGGGVQEGFVDLFSRRALHLSVEYIALQYEWQELFELEEKREALRRFGMVGVGVGRLLLPRKVTIILTYPDGTCYPPDEDPVVTTDRGTPVPVAAG